MATRQLWSVDWWGDFGFFRKPDTNEGVQLSYNMLHKPALLGMLGAVLGLTGYRKKGEWPEYYRRLGHLPIGIAPLDGRHENGTFSKTTITYTNTVGYANVDGNLIVSENTLIEPGYRIFLLIDPEAEIEVKLLDRLRKGNSQYIPYFGKNEFPAFWSTDSVRQYSTAAPCGEPVDRANVVSLISLGETSVWASKVRLSSREREANNQYVYFERLPVGFDKRLFQYQLRDFAYTDYLLTLPDPIEGLWRLDKESRYVYLY